MNGIRISSLFEDFRRLRCISASHKMACNRAGSRKGGLFTSSTSHPASCKRFAASLTDFSTKSCVCIPVWSYTQSCSVGKLTHLKRRGTCQGSRNPEHTSPWSPVQDPKCSVLAGLRRPLIGPQCVDLCLRRSMRENAHG